MRLLDPNFATRRWIKAGLALAGFVAGAVLGLVMTRFGKIAADAPPATLANYAWNAMVLGVLGGVIGPVVTWSSLRNAPIWRAFAEPLGLAFVGASAAIMLGVPALILILPPAGIALGVMHLQRRFPDRVPQGLQEPNADAPSISPGGDHAS
jgi:hypothetical protein